MDIICFLVRTVYIKIESVSILFCTIYVICSIIGVKYLISDMYNQYIDYIDKYFPNAVSVVDSFHVIQWIIQWIIRLIDNYIRQLLKKFQPVRTDLSR